MHQCPGNWVAIGHAVVYYARAAHAFSAGIKYLYCRTDSCNICLQCIKTNPLIYGSGFLKYFRSRDAVRCRVTLSPLR